MRLTENTRKTILSLNNGYRTRTSYSSKNNNYIREYIIINGKLMIKEIGNTSWADSRYCKEWIADKEEVLRFLHNNINKLKCPQ